MFAIILKRTTRNEKRQQTRKRQLFNLRKYPLIQYEDTHRRDALQMYSRDKSFNQSSNEKGNTRISFKLY